MGKAIREFKGDAGRIYVEKASGSDEKPYEVWFEDFHILGLGHTELEALEDAARMLADMDTLVIEAITQVRLNAQTTETTASGGGG